MSDLPMKSNWGQSSTLRFSVRHPFTKYRIPSPIYGATKVGGIALTGPHLELEHYGVGEITCSRYGQCGETGWSTWLAQGHLIPISGYELHALCVNETIEEIVPKP